MGPSTYPLLSLSITLLTFFPPAVLWSPLQETPHLGRNPVYWCTLALFVLLQVPIIKPTNLTCLLIFRYVVVVADVVLSFFVDSLTPPSHSFITGFVGSPALATGGASVSDIYKPEHVPYVPSLSAFSSSKTRGHFLLVFSSVVLTLTLAAAMRWRSGPSELVSRGSRVTVRTKERHTDSFPFFRRRSSSFVLLCLPYTVCGPSKHSSPRSSSSPRY